MAFKFVLVLSFLATLVTAQSDTNVTNILQNLKNTRERIEKENAEVDYIQGKIGVDRADIQKKQTDLDALDQDLLNAAQKLYASQKDATELNNKAFDTQTRAAERRSKAAAIDAEVKGREASITALLSKVDEDRQRLQQRTRAVSNVETATSILFNKTASTNAKIQSISEELQKLKLANNETALSNGFLAKKNAENNASLTKQARDLAGREGALQAQLRALDEKKQKVAGLKAAAESKVAQSAATVADVNQGATMVAELQAGLERKAQVLASQKQTLANEEKKVSEDLKEAAAAATGAAATTAGATAGAAAAGATAAVAAGPVGASAL